MKTSYLLVILILFLSCKSEPKDSGKDDSVTLEEPVDLKGFYKSAPNSKLVYDKLNFGNGYNSVTGKEHFGVMNYESAELSTEVVAGALGNSGFVSMEILESKESLKKSLNINAKVDLDIKVGGFTSDNSAKIDLYKETEFNSFSQNALLKAQYSNEPKVLLNPSVKEKWIKLAKENPDEFMRTCGDMFVSRVYTGGNMYALFSLHSRDSYEKEKNDFFLKSVNKYLGQKLDVEVSTSDLNESMSSVKNINTEVITEGGGNTPTTSDLESFITYANEFKTQVATDGRPIVLYVQLAPYESIAGFPKDVNFDKIRVIQKEFLESCTEHYDDVDESISNAEFVLKNEVFFEASDIDRAKELLNTLPNKITRLRSLMSRCESDFNDCDFEELNVTFIEFIEFDPKMDYPDFVGIDVELTIDPAKGYIEVFPDTGEGKKFVITGKLESRFRDNVANVSCKDVNFKNGHVSRYGYFVKRGFLQKGHYVDIKEYWERPYYMIKYISTETNQTLREFRWNGSPFITEKNVRIEVKLVNTPSKFQWQYDISNKNYQDSWVDIGVKLEKQYGFARAPRFTGLRSCNGQIPIVTVSEPNAKAEAVTTATKSKKYPKTILIDGHITYEYND